MSARALTLPATSTDLIANVFDALPLPAFVVDQEFNVVDFNLAGAKLLDRVPFAVLRLRGAAQQECIHSIETTECAVTQPCQECLIHNFLRPLLDEPTACRKSTRLRLNQDGKLVDAGFLITIAPIPDESEQLALLILDEAQDSTIALASSSPDSKVRGKARARKTDNN